MLQHEFPNGSLVGPSARDLAILARITGEAHFAFFNEGMMVAHPGQPGGSVERHWRASMSEARISRKYGLVKFPFPAGTSVEDAADSLAELARIRRQVHLSEIDGGVLLALPGQSAASIVRHRREALEEAAAAPRS